MERVRAFWQWLRYGRRDRVSLTWLLHHRYDRGGVDGVCWKWPVQKQEFRRGEPAEQFRLGVRR